MTLTPILLAATAAGATFMCVAAGRYLSRKLDRRLTLTTLTAAGVGLALWVYLAHGLLPLLGALAAAGAAVGGWVKWRRAGNAKTVTRYGEKARRRSGVATWWQIAWHASWWTMHRRAAAVRPHLRQVGWWQRWRTPTTEVAVKLCRSSGMWLWASAEDVILAIGGTRKGKTGWLASAICDAPGAVLTTSTRTEIIGLTRAARSRGGRPVAIFNPAGLGDLASTISFNPLTGCADPVVATARAADMIPESEGGEGDRDFWDGQARRHFATFLHAAALDPTGRRTMRDVQRWVANPKAAADELNRLLKYSPDPTAFLEDANQFAALADKTQSSITNAITPALGWLTSPAAVAATQGNTPFDVDALIRERGTVYLLGRHETHTAPLLAALTGYVAREARRLAALEEAGRLDPPLTLALDEAARVSPVPLPDWTGDAGGSGIQLICSFQSRADLIARWGKTGAAKILNNANAVMLYGGTKDPEDLSAWATLAGERDEVVKTRNFDGKVTSTSPRKTPVLAPAQLRALPKFRVVVFTDMPPAVGWVEPAWERRGWKWSPIQETSSLQAPSALEPSTSLVTSRLQASGVQGPSLQASSQSPAPAPAREYADVTH